MGLKILDLFAGFGGTTRGLQKWLDENNISYEYYAIDIDKQTLKVHKYWNKKSIVIQRDAYTFTKDELREYDFIWASPPCQSHSRAQVIWKRRKPDMRLYTLICKLHQVGKPFIVENVVPYYKPPIMWDYKIDRHIFWTNLDLSDVRVNIKRKPIYKMSLHELAEYHGIPYKYVRIYKGDKRQALRNIVNWRISYAIAKQVFPQIIQK